MLFNLIFISPAVVGNLWDVTDKDIDRYCISLLDSAFQQDKNVGVSLPEAVSSARKACKLSYLVGAAPVYYGLPIQFYYWKIYKNEPINI